MTQGPEELARKLAQLAATFVAQIPARVAQMDVHFDAVVNGQGAEALEGLRAEAHKLVGSAGTFGLPDISREARSLEDICTPPGDLDAIKQAFDTLKATIESETAFVRARVEGESDAQVAPDAVADPRAVLLVSQEQDERSRLSEQLRQHGFDVLLDGDAEPAKGLLAVISDLDTASSLGSVSGREDTAKIFVGDGDGIAQRLEAARRGGAAFLPKPVDVTGLLRRLNAIAYGRVDEAARIMIVDDDPAMGQVVQTMLEKAGMSVRLTTDPMKTLDDLDQFVPDVFIFDLLMPSCSGAELAAVVSQDDRLEDIPVLFLSGEQSPQRQAEAMAAGGSAFLAKPVNGGALVSVVRSLVARSRRLRGAVTRDPLTGVFTHNYIKTQLGRELLRVHREQGRLSYAVISIDHFGGLNAGYGYAMGDKVLRYLAASLNARLRRTDACGRLKGARFAVILPDAGLEEASALMRDIALTLADMEVVPGQGAGGLSFSCGLAESRGDSTAESLSLDANLAFEEARDSGGDRIVVTGG
ncbi:MAG: diguanylate cyclase [Rhodospirillales bacterium]